MLPQVLQVVTDVVVVDNFDETVCRTVNLGL